MPNNNTPKSNTPEFDNYMHKQVDRIGHLAAQWIIQFFLGEARIRIVQTPHGNGNSEYSISLSSSKPIRDLPNN